MGHFDPFGYVLIIFCQFGLCIKTLFKWYLCIRGIFGWYLCVIWAVFVYGWYGFTWFGYNVVDLYPLYLFVLVCLSIIASPTVQCLKRSPEPHKALALDEQRRSTSIFYVYYMNLFSSKPNGYDQL